MTERPFILITNDDGIHAPSLALLARELRLFADLVVIAPEHNWSASGHSKTMHNPLRVTPTTLVDGSRALATSGSPSDCVALALLGVVERRPDLVISGINQGANVAQDLTYSGTVSAALEGMIGGIRAISASLDSYTDPHFEVAAGFVARLARELLSRKSQERLLLNVNVPALPEEEIQGVQVTRLGRRIYRDALVERADPRGKSYYWIGGDPPDGVPEEGTDIGALAQGYISVTPILLDLTDHKRLEWIASWGLTLS